MYEELKGKETHNRDLEFLAKWTSSSNLNIQVWTNSPTDTYTLCLPYMATTPCPYLLASSTTQQQHTVRCVGGREDSACCWEGSASSQDRISGRKAPRDTTSLRVLRSHISHITHNDHLDEPPENVGPTMPFIFILTFHLQSRQAAGHFKCMHLIKRGKKKRMAFCKGKENVQYFIWLAIIYYVRGTREQNSKLYNIHQAYMLYKTCLSHTKSKGRHLPG